MSALGNLVRGPVTKALDEAVKAAPASIDTTMASAGVAITGTVTKATEVFTRLYTQATAAVAQWLPSTKPFLLKQLAKIVASIKTSVAKL